MIHKVTSLWAYVAVFPDGHEDIIAAVLLGVGAAPLVSSRPDNVADMERVARKHAEENPEVRVELRRFQQFGPPLKGWNALLGGR